MVPSTLIPLPMLPEMRLTSAGLSPTVLFTTPGSTPHGYRSGPPGKPVESAPRKPPWIVELSPPGRTAIPDPWKPLMTSPSTTQFLASSGPFDPLPALGPQFDREHRVGTGVAVGIRRGHGEVVRMGAGLRISIDRDRVER